MIGVVSVWVVLGGLYRQCMLTVIAEILLALITVLVSYHHITIPGAETSFPLTQPVGISLLVSAMAAAVVEAQLASDS